MSTPAGEAELVSSLLAGAPPGGLPGVCAALAALLGPSRAGLLASARPAAFRAHNVAHCVAAVLPAELGGGGGGPDTPPSSFVLLCPDGELPGGEFLAWGASGAPLAVSVDHEAVAASGGREGVLAARPARPSERPPPALEPFRAALAAAAQAYVAAAHPAGVAAAAVYARPAPPPAPPSAGAVLTVVLSASASQPHNCWAGAARSRWTASFEFGGTAVRLAGALSVHARYTEDGLAQLSSQQEVCAEAAAGDADGLARAVVAAIRAAEAAQYASLGATVAALADTTFRALRRALPVTRLKFGWDAQSGDAHRLALELAAKTRAAAA